MSVDTRYELLLDSDDELYRPPKYHTISAIQDIGKALKLELSNIDFLGVQRRHDIENHAFDREMDCYLNVNSFEVKYVKFPLQISKKQVRCKGQPNQMRLDQEDAKIKLNLVFKNKQFKDIFKVQLQVRRLNPIPNYLKLYTGFVTLYPVELCEDGESTNTVVVHAHLDNLVEEDYQKNIYGISKNDPKQNEFILLIEVAFHDGSLSNFSTKSFTVTGQNKRKAPDSPDSSSSNRSSGIFDSFRDPNENKNFANHQRIVYDIIEAKQGIFENLKANVIKSGKGDIAYHFVLKDQTSGTEYKPGEIIGFTTESSGKVIIDKLSSRNAKNTFLKGVVTESQYIEAFLPEDRNVITATICMLGVVPVRVMGPVIPGEGLFASQYLPGTAVSEKFTESPKADAHIGYAFERVDCKKDEINDVQGLVSIISSAGQDLVVRQLSLLEKSLKHSIKFNTKRSRKCFTLLTVLMLLCGVMFATVIYELKGTGTMYQKWKCKQGNIGTVRYWKWLQGEEYLGYQFKNCRVVWERSITHRRFFKRPHSENPHPICVNRTTKSGTTIKFNYYINLESCAGVIIPGARYMFAVDEHCNSLYVFDEVNGLWEKDKKVCFKQRCNIICNDKKRQCTRVGWESCPGDNFTSLTH